MDIFFLNDIVVFKGEEHRVKGLVYNPFTKRTYYFLDRIRDLVSGRRVELPELKIERGI